jgi:hypothetical protein
VDGAVSLDDLRARHAADRRECRLSGHRTTAGAGSACDR